MRILIAFLFIFSALPSVASELSPQAKACTYLVKAMSRAPAATTIGQVLDYAQLGKARVDVHMTVDQHPPLPDLENIVECQFADANSMKLSAYLVGKDKLDDDFIEKANDALILGGFAERAKPE